MTTIDLGEHVEVAKDTQLLETKGARALTPKHLSMRYPKVAEGARHRHRLTCNR